LPNEDALLTAGAFAESSDEIFSCRMEFITKLGPQINLYLVPIFGVNSGSKGAAVGQFFLSGRKGILCTVTFINLF
jgi:hypothetical protein